MKKYYVVCCSCYNEGTYRIVKNFRDTDEVIGEFYSVQEAEDFVTELRKRDAVVYIASKS